MIIATVGGADSTSYVTISEADNYFETHPYATAWTGYQESQLEYATMMLDSLVVWKGDKATTTQALEFPRLTPKDDGTTIPNKIKRAQMELALHLINNPQFSYESSDFKVIELGEVRIEPNIDKNNSVFVLPTIVQALISEYGSVKETGNSSMTSVRVQRG
jgi:hypothetical protein